MTANGRPWLKEQDDMIRDLHGKVSFSEIAERVNEEFNDTRSRNAVIGRAMRMGLPKLKQPAMPKVVTIRRDNEGGSTIQNIRRRQRRGPVMEVDPFTPRVADAPSRRVTILELKAMECRWADEDRNADGLHTFCGNRTVDASSYCAQHKALAWGTGTASERKAVNLLRKAAA